MNALTLRNAQRDRKINLRLLRRIALESLNLIFPRVSCEIGIHLVGKRAMARTNQRFLQHAGPTDVITFDHSDQGQESARVYGEIYICVAVGVDQAREFATTWPEEIVRYMVHGLLHLRGYDDTNASSRRVMKRAENRFVDELNRRFSLRDLAPHSRLAA